jgi:uncharacterized protein YdhG (YjbR/CyaY superfamily)
VATPGSVDDYLGGLPDDTRAVLERLRATIRAAAPAATEAIGYRMPAFRLNGRFLVSFAAFRDHCSFFPASGRVMGEHGAELEPYFSGKGTLRFTVDRPIPDDLVRAIVLTRIEEVAPTAG